MNHERSVQPILELFDAAIHAAEMANDSISREDWPALHNDVLNMMSAAYALARDYPEPWKRSFEMRAEECSPLCNRILEGITRKDMADTAGPTRPD